MINSQSKLCCYVLGILLIQQLAGRGSEPEMQLDDDGGKIAALLFLDDGERLVSGDRDGYVSLWDLNSKKRLVHRKIHADAISYLAKTGDAKKVISNSLDGKLKEFDTVARTLSELGDIGPSISEIAVCRDKNFLIFGGNEGKLIRWDTKNRRIEKILQTHESSILSCALSPNEKVLAAACFSKVVQVHMFDDPMEKLTLKQESGVTRLLFSSNNAHLLIAFANGKIKVWDVATKRYITDFKAHSRPIASMEIISNTLMATGGVDGVVKLWNTNENRLVKEWDNHGHLVYSICYDRKGKRLAWTRDRSVIVAPFDESKVSQD